MKVKDIKAILEKIDPEYDFVIRESVGSQWKDSPVAIVASDDLHREAFVGDRRTALEMKASRAAETKANKKSDQN